VLWNSLSHGTFPYAQSINLISSWEQVFGLTVPAGYLLIPALIGVSVVGSFERRLGFLISKDSTKGS